MYCFIVISKRSGVRIRKLIFLLVLSLRIKPLERLDGHLCEIASELSVHEIEMSIVQHHDIIRVGMLLRSFDICFVVFLSDLFEKRKCAPIRIFFVTRKGIIYCQAHRVPWYLSVIYLFHANLCYVVPIDIVSTNHECISILTALCKTFLN